MGTTASSLYSASSSSTEAASSLRILPHRNKTWYRRASTPYYAAAPFRLKANFLTAEDFMLLEGEEVTLYIERDPPVVVAAPGASQAKTPLLLSLPQPTLAQPTRNLEDQKLVRLTHLGSTLRRASSSSNRNTCGRGSPVLQTTALSSASAKAEAYYKVIASVGGSVATVCVTLPRLQPIIEFVYVPQSMLVPLNTSTTGRHADSKNSKSPQRFSLWQLSCRTVRRLIPQFFSFSSRPRPPPPPPPP